jgi:hypothetical protein
MQGTVAIRKRHFLRKSRSPVFDVREDCDLSLPMGMFSGLSFWPGESSQSARVRNDRRRPALQAERRHTDLK